MMLGGLQVKIAAFALISIILGVSLVLAKSHYEGLLEKISNQQTEIEGLKFEKAGLQASLRNAAEREADLVADRENANKRVTEAQESLQASLKSMEKTRELFANHDFANLLVAKPGLLERRMRAATASQFKGIREASKAP